MVWGRTILDDVGVRRSLATARGGESRAEDVASRQIKLGGLMVMIGVAVVAIHAAGYLGAGVACGLVGLGLLVLGVWGLVHLPGVIRDDPGCSMRGAGAMLAKRECASCRYDLSGVRGGETGLVTCPECGAGWRSDRVGATVEPVGSSMVLDEAGRAVEVASEAQVGEAEARADEVLKERLLAAREAMVPSAGETFVSSMGAIGVAIFMMFALGAVAAFLWSMPGLLFALTTPITSAGLALVLIGWGRLRQVTTERRRSRRVVEVLLARRLCPSCLQDLSFQSRADVQVCPKCRAAWPGW